MDNNSHCRLLAAEAAMGSACVKTLDAVFVVLYEEFAAIALARLMRS